MLMSPIFLPASFTGAGGDQVLFELFIIFAAAKIAAEVFERFKQPAVVGEILAGVVIGPSLLKLVAPSQVTQALSEIGVMLLLFMVGLEINSSALLKVGGRALLVAVSGVVVPFIAGWAVFSLWQTTGYQSIFMGAALVATSVGITARVLGTMNVLNTKASQIILGAAVIDDILGLIVLSIVSSLARGGINYAELGVTAGLSIGFTVFVMVVGTRLVKRAQPQIENLKVNEAYFIVGILLCLGLSWLGTLVGVAALIGAFLAGMALGESTEHTKLHAQASSVMEFSVPFFLVSIGLQLDLSVFKDAQVITLALVTTLVAVVTKLVACGLVALPMGKRTALQVGMGMVPRGEVGIIVAQIGLKSQVLSPALYAVVIFMAVATTLVAPPFLTILFKPSVIEPDVLVEDGSSEFVEPDQSLSDLG